MADEADLDAIRQFVASGGQFQTDKAGNPVAPIDPSDATPEAEPAQPQPSPAPQAPQPKQGQQRQQGRQQKPPQGKALKRAGGAFAAFSRAVENVPTPGGNLALVLLLVFFAFAIIPVNSGKTRLQLIWDVLTGNASLMGTGQAGGTAGVGIGGILNNGASNAQQNVNNNPTPSTGPSTGTVTGIGLGYTPNLPGQTPVGAGPVYLSNHLNDPTALLEAPRGDW